MRVMKAAERFPKHRIVLVPEGKSGSFRPINLSVREKLAPSAAGPFPCSGRAWNFCLVQREGRRYRLMQRPDVGTISLRRECDGFLVAFTLGHHGPRHPRDLISERDRGALR